MFGHSPKSFIKAFTAGLAVLSLLQPSPAHTLRPSGATTLPSTRGTAFQNPYQLRPLSTTPSAINNVPIKDIIAIPPAVKANIRTLYAAGVKKGNNPRAFSALGDSSIAGGFFLERFNDKNVKLGDYDFLLPAMIAFTDSFSRTSASVRIGMHSWTAMNPVWADKKRCEPDENAIACEFRLNQPSILFIHLGANDTANQVFDKSMRKIVTYALSAGVVPVLITKAQLPNSNTRANNDTLRAIATAYNVPLLDFEVLSKTLPKYGLGDDDVHMTNFNKPDYTRPALFKSGHAMHNLAALITLDAVWRAGTTID
jgi:hypothetical protein